MTTPRSSKHASLALVAAILLVASPSSAFRAKLLDATWNASELPSNSTLSEADHVLTTEFPSGSSALVAYATLTYDIERGTDGILQFTSTHPWVRCQAPEGLEVPESGKVAVVCRPDADKLAKLRKKTKVYVKADPPGGRRHKKLYWVLVPTSE